MHAVLELVVAVVLAFGVAVLSQFGGAADRTERAAPQAERVVARSPQAQPRPAPAMECHDDDRDAAAHIA